MQMKEVEGREGTSGGTDFFFPSLSLELRLSLPMDRSFEGKKLLERSGGEAQTRKEGRGGEAKVTEGSEERGIKKVTGRAKKKSTSSSLFHFAASLFAFASSAATLLFFIPTRLPSLCLISPFPRDELRSRQGGQREKKRERE